MARREISGSRILVTGASQGIGRALVIAAARRGAKVLAASRQLDLLHELFDELAEQKLAIEVIGADVTVPADRQAMMDMAIAKFGGLDVLINNAGIGATGHFVDATPTRLRTIMEVNLFGVTETTRVALPLLRQGKSPAIVNISSIAGKLGLPARSEYCASKFAVQGFSQALRAECAKDDIDVIVICPGLTQTNFSKNLIEARALMQYDHMRGMTAEEVAEATLVALERGTAEVWLTWQGKLLAFAARFIPWVVNWGTRLTVRRLFADEIRRRDRARGYRKP